MSRGLLTVLSGLLPIGAVFLLDAVADLSKEVGGTIAIVCGFSMLGLFFLGTVIIAVDKGHSVVIGIVLGFIAPLGTIFAVMLDDQSHYENERPRRSSKKRKVKVSAAEKSAAKKFGAMRTTVTRVAAAIGIIYGLINFGVSAKYMLSFKGGIMQFKLATAGVQGALSALCFWGLVVMLTLSFAPEKWLLKSREGKQWMARTGLSTRSNTMPLRVMSVIIAVVCAGWLFVSINVILSALNSDRF